MPNWCSNTLIVSGDEKQLKDFVEKSLVKADNNSPNDFDFTFEGLYPTPKELVEVVAPPMWRGDETDTEGKEAYQKHLAELIGKYGHDNWYDWRVENWSTKWDCAESYISVDNTDTFIVSYDTAWSPNINWMKYVSELYPDLHFELQYMETGCSFCGVATCENGEVNDNEGEIEYTDQWGREVYYDSEIERYRYSDDNEVIDDEDFWPVENNPFVD